MYQSAWNYRLVHIYYKEILNRKFHILCSAVKKTTPAGVYLLKVNNRNTRTRGEICSELTIKIPERRQLGKCWLGWDHVSYRKGQETTFINKYHVKTGMKTKGFQKGAWSHVAKINVLFIKIYQTECSGDAIIYLFNYIKISYLLMWITF